MTIRHILFDNDGTLVDSEALALEIMLDTLREFGIDYERGAYTRRFPGLLERDIFEAVSREHGVQFPADIVPRMHRANQQAFDEKLEAIPGMAALFKKLQTPKSMVSNGSAEHVERCLKRVQLWQHFAGRIFSANHVERPKPHPDVYLFALETLGLRPAEALAVEDSPAGVSAAKSAGIRVVGFLGASHLGDGHDARLRDLGADFIADDAAALSLIMNQLGCDFAE